MNRDHETTFFIFEKGPYYYYYNGLVWEKQKRIDNSRLLKFCLNEEDKAYIEKNAELFMSIYKSKSKSIARPIKTCQERGYDLLMTIKYFINEIETNEATFNDLICARVPEKERLLMLDELAKGIPQKYDKYTFRVLIRK